MAEQIEGIGWKVPEELGRGGLGCQEAPWAEVMKVTRRPQKGMRLGREA